MVKFCGNSERGELELSSAKQNNNYEDKEEGKRNYTCTKNTINYFIEFCSSGTIHGIRYFSENRTWIEKLWWAISIGVSLYFCIHLIIIAYIRWENSPVIVSFATVETPVWKIPFPTVTICPEAKARPSIFNYTDYLYKKQDNITLTPEEEKKFGYLSFVCESKLNLKYTSGRFADEEMIDFLNEAQPQFNKTFISCKYLGKKYECSELFVPIMTDDGICYTFNIVDRSQLLRDLVVHYKNFHSTKVSHDWNLETGYGPNAGLDAYPRRSLYSGIPNGLTVKLLVDEDDLDYTCGTSIKGFKVLISHPQRMPRLREQHFIVPLNRVAKAAMSPDMMATSSAVKQYNPKRRNCYFPSERPLKYFKLYSQNNCQIECRANYTIQKCACASYYMPREKNVPICGAESHQCIKDALSELKQVAILRKINESFNERADVPECKCYSICTSMYYLVENSQANYDWRRIYYHNRIKDVNLDDKTIHLSKLQVFFKGNQFIHSERNELYGSTEFLANVGGLLGLFIGFSALSFVEIIYYLTLRIFCNIVIFGRRNWSGTTD